MDASSLALPAVVGTAVGQGSYLNAATARESVAVLGAEADQLMGIDRIRRPSRPQGPPGPPVGIVSRRFNPFAGRRGLPNARTTDSGFCLQPLLYLSRVSRMSRRAALSPQTLAVLAALLTRPSSWRHGYDLAVETGLKSGTLYPILVRLADREIVEARWEEGDPAGRPRRHLYRLTSDGLATATAALAAAPRAGASPARPRPATGRRLAGEGS